MKPSASFRRKIFSFAVFLVLSALFSTGHFAPPAETSQKTSIETVENYDIRFDKNNAAAEKFIADAGKTPAEIARLRKSLTHAETNLQKRESGWKIERSEFSGNAEIITPDFNRGTSFLTEPTAGRRADVLRDFLKENAELIGLEDSQIDALKTTADYTNPDGNLSYVHFEQFVKNIPVFQGEVKAGLTKRGEIIRVVNNLAPHLDYDSLANDFGATESAVEAAASHIGRQANEDDLKRIAADELKIKFGRGQFADVTTAEKMYFPIDAGVARAAWRVLLWTKDAAFYVVVDADDGTLLWRKNITSHQTQSATFEVYGNLTSMMKTADSPTPGTPGCNDPNKCPQPPMIARQSFSLIGNESPYAFNNTGWIPDGENRTIGNNVEAGIDRDGTNGVDPLGYATGNPNRTFVYVYNPAPGMPPPGEQPAPPLPQTYPPTAFQQGSVTNAFYIANRFHDEMYRLGFTEAARNFQLDNFGRGGTGNDHLSVEVQDSSGTNGGNFATPADGGRGRLQSFIWTGPTPDRDAALDAQFLVHELTHGVSNRLHGNGSGLGTNFAAGMGEGWSDFYAQALLSEPTDNLNGTYALACYITLEITPGFNANCYYGIRRFPLARISVLGPNGRPHNPLTFRYLNSDCNTLIGTTTSNPPPSSAYPRGPIGVAQCDQVHNIGEIWAAALWEVRGFLIDAHGAAEGNRRALQYITDGMKLAPLQPNFLQERDAIIAATSAINPSDVIFVRRGFARRGMGASASIQNTTSPIAVTEAFDELPNVAIGAGFAVSDAPGNNNGYPEPGEPVVLTVPLENTTGNTITGVTLQIVGGASAAYGDIANGQTVTRTINYTIPNNAPCGGLLTINFNINSSSGLRAVTRSFRTGAPVGGPTLTFASSTPLTIPDNGASTPYGTTINASGITGNKKIKLEVTGLTHTFPGDLDLLLVGPGGQKYSFLSDSGGAGNVSNLTFTLSDGATAQPSATQWTTGEFRPVNITSGDTFPAPAPSAPYSEAPPAGTSTFSSVFGDSGAAMNGTWTLYVVDDAAGDSGTMAGWKLIVEPNDYLCCVCPFSQKAVVNSSADNSMPPACTCIPPGSRADFDGDGRTDISVFRPSDGNWYVNRSFNGFMAVNWGLSGDRLTPGDFDGDGKADFAVFRPDAGGTLYDFYVLRSSTLTFAGYSWGLPGDIPVIEDYDGDGRADVAVYRPSNHTFYVLRSTGGNVMVYSAITSGVPLTGDFDGDNKGDFVTYSTNGWYLASSSTNYASVSFTLWGADGDKPVPADYDGDGRDDFAVFRPSDRVWYIRQSVGGNLFFQFGLSTDIPVPADYDGDRKADIAVFRDGVWYINRSTAGMLITQFGLPDDKPIPNSYLP